MVYRLLQYILSLCLLACNQLLLLCCFVFLLLHIWGFPTALRWQSYRSMMIWRRTWDGGGAAPLLPSCNHPFSPQLSCPTMCCCLSLRKSGAVLPATGPSRLHTHTHTNLKETPTSTHTHSNMLCALWIFIDDNYYLACSSLKTRNYLHHRVRCCLFWFLSGFL